MKPFYVYLLIDPINNEIFYVGKGIGRRAEDHEKVITIDSEREKSKKIIEINERENHNKVKIRIVGRFETEAEAFSVESVLIKWVYGLVNLTNEVHGHRHKNIRPFNSLEKIQGLDIEKKAYLNDGKFTEELKNDNRTYNVEDKLTELRENLHKHYPDLDISFVDLSKPKDPSIYIKINEFTRCQLMLKGNGRDNVIFNVRTMFDRKNDISKFNETYNDFDIKNPNNAPYFKLDGWKEFNPHYKNEFSEILSRVKLVFNQFIL